MRSRTRFALQLGFSLLIGGVLCYLAMRDWRWGDIPDLVRQMDWRWVLPYILIFLCSHLLRLLRWGILLAPLGSVRTWRLVALGSVGFMAIILFPLRLGEFVRPYLVSRESSIRMSSALATCMAERAVDGLVVALMLFLVLGLLPGEAVPDSVVYAGHLALIAFIAAVSLLLGMHWKRTLTLRLLQRSLGRVAPGLSDRACGLLSSFIDGLQALPSARAITLFLAMTAAYWICNGLGFWVLFRAAGLTLENGQPPGLLAAYTIMSILAIGIILPGGPAFAGNFEFSLSLGLGLFLTAGMLATRGAVYILLTHGLQFFLQVATGFAFLVTGSVSLRGTVKESRSAVQQVGTE